MGGNEQKPIIRFRGFTDSWEQRKLSDLAEIIGGGTPDTNIPAYWDGDIDWYAPAEMEGQRYASSSVRKITELGLQKSSAKMLPAQRTVLFTSRAGIGKMAILQRPAATNQGFQSLVLKDGTEPYFIYSMGVNIKEMAEGVASGSTFLEISGKMLGNLEVMVPTLKEQEAIAAFFRNIDDLITLHQREHDILVNVKKSMLERLFPREGSNVPEIRFAGFNNAWTKHKVTELGDIYIGLVTTMTSHYTDHGTLLIRNSDIKDGRFQFGSNPIYLDDDFAKQNTSRKHRVGDVITVHTGDIGTSAVITEKEAGSIGFATIVTRPDKGKITSEFLCTYLNTDAHKNFAMNISTGDGRNNYNLKDYYECIIPLPCIEEQKKISSFVSGLNRLINTHQHKLEKLQSIKASMLERMFV